MHIQNSANKLGTRVRVDLTTLAGDWKPSNISNMTLRQSDKSAGSAETRITREIYLPASERATKEIFILDLERFSTRINII